MMSESTDISRVDPYLEVMKRVSSNDAPVPIAGDTVKLQIQSFVLAQAQKELLRVVKYTEFLDKVEDEYQKRVEENLEDISFNELPEIMTVIHTSLDRAQNMLLSVIKDDKLGVFISNTFNTINTPETSSISPDSGLSMNAASREAVRKAVTSLIKMIDDQPPADYTIESQGDSN